VLFFHVRPANHPTITCVALCYTKFEDVCFEVTYKVVAYVLPFKVLCFLDDLDSSNAYIKLKHKAVFMRAMKEYGMFV